MRVTVKPGIQDHFCGFYNHIRRRPDDSFDIKDEPRRVLFPGEQKRVNADPALKAVYDKIKDGDGKIPQEFSFVWMEPTDAKGPEVTSTSQQAMDKRSDEIKQEKAGARAIVEPGKAQNKDVL